MAEENPHTRPTTRVVEDVTADLPLGPPGLGRAAESEGPASVPPPTAGPPAPAGQALTVDTLSPPSGGSKGRDPSDATAPSGGASLSSTTSSRGTRERRFLEWKPGTIVAGRYLIKRNLGVGGTGLVLVADDMLLRKPVAIKALRPSVAQDSDNVERFRKEVALCHAITHPNVVRTYDLGEDEGVHYFSMELLEGEPLSNRLKKEKKLSADEVRRLGIYICRGLQAAHEAKIVHRDLKPSNIMLVPAPRHVVVMDLGISGLVDAEADSIPGDGKPEIRDPAAISSGEWEITSAGWGTPKYMSPEQWIGAPCGAPADIYSLGAILFQCATGRPPFEAGSDREFAAAHMNREAPSLRAVDPSLPADLERIVAKCLEKDPRKRFQTANQLADALAGRRHVPAWVRFVGRALGLAAVLAVLGAALIMVAHRAIIQEMRPAVSRLAELLSTRVQPEDLIDIRAVDDVELPVYERIRQMFTDSAAANPEVASIYILRAHAEPHTWEIVVDLSPFWEDTDGNGQIDEGEQAMPGTPYESAQFPAMWEALESGTATSDEGFGWDEYGLTLSGYAPIGTNRGPAGYIIGVDVGNQRLTLFDRFVIGLCAAAWLLLLFGPRLIGLLRRRRTLAGA